MPPTNAHARTDPGGPPAPAVAPITPRLIPMADVATLTGLGLSTVEKRNAAGLLPAPRKVGKRNLWDRVELEAWMSRPKKDGSLMTRAEWQPVWQAMVKGKAVPA